MLANNPFVIYNASAGSGKTFTLVKAYLKILFKSSSTTSFKNILAITFTNKAAGEMKSRIIESLKSFSSDASLINPDPMFLAICEELDITNTALHEKSKVVLNAIIYNYAAFDISTIDGFTHKLIRTFAYDLKLPLNFEVELDVESLLNEAVDRLISKAGFDKQLTRILIAFAIEKADDDKSWDVSKDFYTISKLLVNENDIPFIETLKDKSLDDFKVLKNQIYSRIQETEKQIISEATKTLNFIKECGLQFDDFTSKYLPLYFENLTNKKFNLKFNLKWQIDLIEGERIYPKRVSSDISGIVESIQTELAAAYTTTKKFVFEVLFLNAVYKNITPLSVLTEIQKELEEIKQEQNVMLISEFNSIISNEIKNQPTPFIYERLGEKFKHYFIDEFQDTSILQWQNLIPLLENSLSSANGSVMLVGDAKQAIYRWRGGKADQFVSLYNQQINPFNIDSNVIELKSNYRSYKEIITFNNGFFNYLGNIIFSNPDYQNLYQNANQLVEKKQNGYVNLSFLDFETGDDKDLMYSKQVYETIMSCLEKGFLLNDICVLVRKKKEGIAIANYLSEKGINIMSSETLLLNNSAKVRFINNVLKLLLHPENQEIKADVLIFLIDFCNIKDKHQFLKSHIQLEASHLFNSFEKLGFSINYNQLLQLSFYDLVETIVRDFKLITDSDAYIQYYMDVVLEFSQKQLSDLNSFIDYYEKKGDRLSIVSPDGVEAVQVMTIHKSKGLEFPVVIFPFADMNIYKEINPKEWFPIDPKVYNGFSNALLNYNSAFENYGETGVEIYNKHKSEVELDNINILYVALTRAVEQLYIISKRDINSKGIVNEKTFSGFFINYLQHENIWKDEKAIYGFGENIKESEKSTTTNNTLVQQEFISTPKETHNIHIITKSGYLWDTVQEQAIEKGNLIHNIMSLIKTKKDVDFVFSDYLNSSIINEKQASYLKDIVFDIISHPALESYYMSNNTIYNERDIISNDGLILRPDRLVINSANEVVIIDYKSGKENQEHELQLQNYEAILTKMNLKVIKKILIYINDTIQVKEF